MTRAGVEALLPTGLRDLLPPDAAFEAEVVQGLLSVLAAHGYERVDPPLVEFEASLLAGGGAATARQTFRLMDPVSRRMMGVRADMTPQVARIATTRLKSRPRPLRLSYAGQVLRVKGSQLRSERQFVQAGAELIGSAEPGADVEVVLMAVEALTAVGVDGLSVDLGLPCLVPAVAADLNLSGIEGGDLRAALDRKDAAGVAALADVIGGKAADILTALVEATGPAERALEALAALELGPEAARERAGLAAVADGIRRVAPELSLTIDLVESRGFEYHTGVAFTIFARAARGELGSGGRYRAGGSPGEPATGFTLFLDAVVGILGPTRRERRVFLPAGTPEEEGRGLRREGWVTLGGLESVPDPILEARRLDCTHVLLKGTLRHLTDNQGG